MRQNKMAVAAFVAPALFLFSLVFLVPILVVFATSFFTWKGGAPLYFSGLKNYGLALEDTNMWVAIKNTLIWVFLQSTIHVGIGVVFAFILAKKPIFWKLFRTIYMIPNVTSMAALAIIYLNLFSPEMGIVNSLIGKFIGHPFAHNWYFNSSTAFFTVTLSWILYSGLISILVLAGIMAVPKEIIEAAKIDGASSWQIDVKIIIPMIRNVLGTCVILASTSMLKEFELIYLTTNGGPGSETLNLPLYLYKTSLTENNYGYANMMGVLLMGLGILIVICANKIFKMDESYY